MKMPETFSKDGNLVNVIIETPGGSRIKYNYDPDLDLFSMSRILPPDVVFPLDFGFIPKTLGEDGDPVDILLFIEKPTFPGALVKARIIGVLEAKQKEKDGKFIRNDRILAVADGSHDFEKFRTVEDVNSYTLNSLNHFFEHYHDVDGGKYIPIDIKGPKTALALIKAQMQ